jgi:beta-glucosidase
MLRRFAGGYLSAAVIFLLALSPATPVRARTSSQWRFPKDFVWGAATAAHQTEGNNSNSDWWEWEQQCRLPGCAQSGAAADGYRRYASDLDMAQELGLNAYRLSLEWARVEPHPGVFSDVELDHYRSVLRAAHARGLRTVLTLHHFTLPLWVAHHAVDGNGSWLDPAIPDLFARYAERVVTTLGSEVDYWITINEPTVNMLSGYVVGVGPPGIQDFKKAPVVLANMLKAHARAYHAIHRFDPKARVSIAHHARVFDPYRSWHPADQLAASLIHDFWNHQFIRSIRDGKISFSIPTVVSYDEDAPEIKGTLDYLGINYYTRDLVEYDSSSPQKFALKTNSHSPKSDMGWEIYPLGFYRVLKDMSQYHYPILVTENGIADAKDTLRPRFLCDHLRELARAMEDGVQVWGYLYWSLLDNFEWNSGFGPRFGLAEVDYDTQERHVRPSARILTRTIAASQLSGCQDSSTLY